MLPRPEPLDESAPYSGNAWLYQTCLEVGLYAVHNPDRTQSVMSEVIDDAFYDMLCDATTNRRPDVAKARAEYFDPIVAGQVSNVFFVNGSADPWSALSLTDPSSTPPGSEVFVIQQGSHCSDLQNLTRDSMLGVFEAHLKFNRLAKRWLAETSAPPPMTNTPPTATPASTATATPTP
jgi:hypothetical protein